MKNNSKILNDKVKVLEPELRGGSDPSRSINKKLGNRKAKNEKSIKRVCEIKFH